MAVDAQVIVDLLERRRVAAVLKLGRLRTDALVTQDELNELERMIAEYAAEGVRPTGA